MVAGQAAPLEARRFSPERIDSIEASGLRIEFIADLVLKTIYLYGTITPRDMMALLKLPFTGVLDLVLKRLLDQDLVFIRRRGGIARLRLRADR